MNQSNRNYFKILSILTLIFKVFIQDFEGLQYLNREHYEQNWFTVAIIVTKFMFKKDGKVQKNRDLTQAMIISFFLLWIKALLNFAY